MDDPRNNPNGNPRGAGGGVGGPAPIMDQPGRNFVGDGGGDMPRRTRLLLYVAVLLMLATYMYEDPGTATPSEPSKPTVAVSVRGACRLVRAQGWAGAVACGGVLLCRGFHG